MSNFPKRGAIACLVLCCCGSDPSLPRPLEPVSTFSAESDDLAHQAGTPKRAGFSPSPCGETNWEVKDGALHLLGACAGAALALRPIAKVDGQWLGGGLTGPCFEEGSAVVCDGGPLGRVGVTVAEGKLRPYWQATSEANLESMGLDGSLTLPLATGFLSNGLQSWSQSGVLALGAPPAEAALERALRAQGEAEVYRRGRELSFWYTFVGGGPLSLVAGATTAARFRSYVQVYRGDADLHLRLISGAGESIETTPGQELPGEWFHLEIGTDLEAMLRRYSGSLATRRARKPVAAPAGWNSWYDLWDNVRADDIVPASGRGNAELAQQILGRVLPERATPAWIVVDDGWQKAWGTWEPNAKFSRGLEDLTGRVEALGMRAGIWFAPLLVHPAAEIARKHPEWLVKGATYDHPAHGGMGILDVTHPAAAAHLEQVVKSLVAAGMGLLKVDFLFAGMWEGDRYEKVTGMQAYARALDLIRRAAGEETLLVAVGAPPLVTIEYADVWRVGNDIAFKPLPFVGLPRPSFSFIANQARQFTSRWPFCLATLCDTDPALLRTLAPEQVEVGAWIAAASGGALFLSDDLRKLPKARQAAALDATRAKLALSEMPATPEDFFPEQLPTSLVNMKDEFFSADHSVPSVWRWPDGSRRAFNFSGSATTIEGLRIPARAVRSLPPR